jgi:transcriptional regulator with XRE-family HTH domain
MRKLTVGERIEMRRRRRGLSRRVMANLVGRSEEWLRLVESGRRQLDSIEVLTRLAEVLQVDDPAELIDWPSSRSAVAGENAEQALRPLRMVIVDHPALRVYDDGAPGSPTARSGDAPVDSAPVDTTALAAALAACRDGWSRSPRRFSGLARELPPALHACRDARWRRQSADTAELLVTGYHLARELLTACGDHGLAATVADRSMGTSAQIHHPRLVAASAWHVADTLRHLSYPGASRDYALAAARVLAADVPDAAEDAVLWGALHLLAAHSAAAARDSAESTRLRGIASRVADRLGADAETLGITFGPTEIGITGIQIALTRHDPDEAIRLAAEVEPAADYPLQRRAKYHVCQAAAYVSRRDDVAAVVALGKAANISPEDIRHDADAHRALQYLVRRDNYLVRAEVSSLTRLADIT